MPKNISGAAFRKMVTSGAKFLELNRDKVDSLNVFPVPDGDTGTNMSLTFQSAVKEINTCESNNFSEISEAFARGALRGARGNSGVILSQIIRGMAAVIKDVNEIDTKAMAKALKNGAEVAHNAVTKPKEGTILTVIREMAEHALAECRRITSMENFLESVIAKGDVVLSKTPEMLDVLKKAGVVDAGGMGIVTIFKGMLKGLKGEEIEGDLGDDSDEEKESSDVSEYADITSLEKIEFAYCTEFFIVNLKKKTTLAAIDRLREKLTEIGDCVLVIGDLAFVKVHVHTNRPGVALQYALELGELDNLKIENMLQQNRKLIAKLEAEKKEIGMLAICAGDGLVAIFKDLSVDKVIEGGQTMNPSAEDIATAASKINAENIFIFPNNKNIILAAEQSKALIENKKLHVIPTKSVPHGIAAALCFDPEISVEENKINMIQSLDNVVTGQITYAVRNTNLDGFSLKEGDIIGLDNKHVLSHGKDVAEVACDLVGKLKNKSSEIVTLYYGKEVRQEDADALTARLAETYPNLEIDAHYGGQPIYYYFISVE